jgi:hypothetical protein
MIRIRSEGTALRVDVDIPSNLNDGKLECYPLKTELGGSDVAVRALAIAMQEKLDQTIQLIRKEAYRQGARDRAMRANSFTCVLRAGVHRGGCW